MMNPSFDACKKQVLKCDFFLPRDVGGVDLCSSIIPFDNISSVHSILVHFGHVQMKTILF